ncbi:MAG: 2-isopropylmalate synthase [Planctomycetes bacterium]|nr:2-isopropylmalate synthase [Planctomycetota bacterium]
MDTPDTQYNSSRDTPAYPRVMIFDTTLRDGEQSPGASLNLPEKLEIAHALENLGVDIIEAGFPITSPGDFEAVHAVAAEITNSTVAGLARCTERDVRRAGEAVGKAARGRIHIFLATSKIHREFKLKKAKEEIIRLTVENVKLAREYVADVEFSPEDASRTELDYLAEVVHAAIEAGATTINCPDTVGNATPSEYRAMFEYLLQHVPGAKNVIFSSHCHNDLGLAVANSLSAVLGGARQVECTINGIGERAGNAALEEIVMAMRTRPDQFPFSTRINSRRLVPCSRLVSTLTGLHVQRNKAIVGENAFAHEAGIHQDGILKERSTYEIIVPEDVGWVQNKLVLGKHSGRHAFRQRLEELGHHLDEAMLDRAFEAFKALGDKKKEIYDEDLEALMDEQLKTDRQLFQLKNLQVMAGTYGVATATVTLLDSTGVEITDAAIGDGPVDAMFAAIQRLTRISAQLDSFQVRSITGGREAQGEVTVELTHHNHKVRGRGFSTDILEASAKAYLTAINRIRTITQRTVGQASPLDA